MPVPYAPVDQDVEEGCADADLAVDGCFVVVDLEGRQQDRVLEGEVVLGVEVDTLQPGSRSRRTGC
jgi:hypothetical protein